MGLDEARATGSVILGLEWQRPNAGRYHKLRSGRAGLPEFAVAVAVKDRGDGRRLTAAVWRGGSSARPRPASVSMTTPIPRRWSPPSRSPRNS
jgi:hypothetical protein